MLGWQRMLAHGHWAPARRTQRYEQRRPEQTVLHQVVREHYQTVLHQAAERSEHGLGYPTYVAKEFERYLDCGQLGRGFSRLRCRQCGFERLLAFSCKGRLCPSCTGRRMDDTAAHLVTHLLPVVPRKACTWNRDLMRSVIVAHRAFSPRTHRPLARVTSCHAAGSAELSQTWRQKRRRSVAR